MLANVHEHGPAAVRSLACELVLFYNSKTDRRRLAALAPLLVAPLAAAPAAPLPVFYRTRLAVLTVEAVCRLPALEAGPQLDAVLGAVATPATSGPGALLLLAYVRPLRERQAARGRTRKAGGSACAPNSWPLPSHPLILLLSFANPNPARYSSPVVPAPLSPSADDAAAIVRYALHPDRGLVWIRDAAAQVHRRRRPASSPGHALAGLTVSCVRSGRCSAPRCRRPCSTSSSGSPPTPTLAQRPPWRRR